MVRTKRILSGKQRKDMADPMDVSPAGGPIADDPREKEMAHILGVGDTPEKEMAHILSTTNLLGIPVKPLLERVKALGDEDLTKGAKTVLVRAWKHDAGHERRGTLME